MREQNRMAGLCRKNIIKLFAYAGFHGLINNKLQLLSNTLWFLHILISNNHVADPLTVNAANCGMLIQVFPSNVWLFSFVLWQHLNWECTSLSNFYRFFCTSSRQIQAFLSICMLFLYVTKIVNVSHYIGLICRIISVSNNSQKLWLLCELLTPESVSLEELHDL